MSKSAQGLEESSSYLENKFLDKKGIDKNTTKGDINYIEYPAKYVEDIQDFSKVLSPDKRNPLLNPNAGRNTPPTSQVPIGDETSEKPKRINFSLTPKIRAEFEEIAGANGMSLTKFLRCAGFAVKNDPSLLKNSEVQSAETDYISTLGASRWTRERA